MEEEDNHEIDFVQEARKWLVMCDLELKAIKKERAIIDR
jgi:hypothetical protein